MIDPKKAILTQIAFLASHDGPGMRTTLFFKGCPLRCKWCHNPETIYPRQELSWDQRKCIGCKTCLLQCPYEAVDFRLPHLIRKQNCVNCFDCVETCPSRALQITGKVYDLEELEYQIIQEKQLLKSMGGGVTFSGGEPTLQTPFIASLAQKLKQEDIHLALDTCGYTSWENYQVLLPYMDLILYDLKEMDPVRHRNETGVDNHLIHENLLRMCQYIQEEHLPTHIWIRTPVIPEMTATLENIQAIARLLSPMSAFVDKWELCAFNNLCRDKYHQLGTDWTLEHMPLLTQVQFKRLLDVAQQSALKQVVGSGLYQND